MKRTVFIIMAVITATMATMAQDIFESSDNKAKFGVHLSWDLNSPSTTFNAPISTVHNGSGISAGAFYSLPIYKNLYVEPGLNLFYNTMIISQDIIEDIEVGYPLTPEGSLRNAGLRVPLTFGYRFDFTDNISVALFTGPQFNIGVTLKEFNNHTKRSHSLYDDGWRRVDAQWLLGVRFYYSDNWIAEISGGIGMTNLLDTDKYHHEHFRRNSFSIGVGYIF